MSEKPPPPDQLPPDAGPDPAPLGFPHIRMPEPELAVTTLPAPPSPEPPAPPEEGPPPLPKPGRVAVAEPFTMVSRDAAFADARTVTVAAIRAWMEKPPAERRFLFDDCREACHEVTIVEKAATIPAQLWIIGDLHADVLALANIIAHADRSAAPGEQPAFLFLGDFVDRGRHDHETLLLLFKLCMTRPGRVCVVPGNHDTDLRWDEAARRFRVSIEPAEYCEWLNGKVTGDAPVDREEVELGKLFVQLCKDRPKAVVFPDGTLFAHGGFPHTDAHASLCEVANLGDARCVSDFMWARLSESPKKRPNRGNRGHEFGWRDFAEFCRVMTDVIKVPVRRLVRGHDHVPERWRVHPEYAETPVLTLNAMGRRMDGEPRPADGPHPFPAMAQYVPDQLPEVVLLPLAAAEVDRAFELDRESPAGDLEEHFAPFVEGPGG